MIGTLSRHRRAALAAAASRAARAEASLDVAAASAAAAERVRIARELHDVVAHHVSLMAVQAEAVGALLPARPDRGVAVGRPDRGDGPAGDDGAAPPARGAPLQFMQIKILRPNGPG